jgi:hypothetical protein
MLRKRFLDKLEMTGNIKFYNTINHPSTLRVATLFVKEGYAARGA